MLFSIYKFSFVFRCSVHLNVNANKGKVVPVLN